MKHSFLSLSKKGFTLVELIIVVSIIAILAALSFIALSGETSNARDAKRAADLQVIEDAISNSNAKARKISYGTKTGTTGYINTNAGYVGSIRGAKIVEVDNNVFDATILPSAPRDPKGMYYIAAFLTDNLYQIFAVKENSDTKVPSALVKGSFREGAVIDQLTADMPTGATSIPVNNGLQFLPGDVIVIDSETMTGGAVTSNTVAVGGVGTTSSQHKKGAPVKLQKFADNAGSLVCFGTAVAGAGVVTAAAGTGVCGGSGAVINEITTAIPYNINN